MSESYWLASHEQKVTERINSSKSSTYFGVVRNAHDVNCSDMVIKMYKIMQVFLILSLCITMSNGKRDA